MHTPISRIQVDGYEPMSAAVQGAPTVAVGSTASDLWTKVKPYLPWIAVGGVALVVLFVVLSKKGKGANASPTPTRVLEYD